MRKKIIVNAARAIDTKGGVSNVANALDKEFNQLGYETRQFTLSDTGIRHCEFSNNRLNKLWLIFEIFWASVVGSWILKKRYPKSDYWVISHNDFLYGQTYVNHGLHKALVSQNGLLKMGIRNPLHFFLYARETIRHKYNVHQQVVCFSEKQKQEFKEHYPLAKDVISIIPNGIDLVRFNSKNPLPDDAISLKPQGKKAIIFVGYEFERKGLVFALKALTFLPDSWRLIVVGGDSRQIQIASLQTQQLNLTNRVTFTGPRYDVEKLYCLADCFVLPASFEPWGLVAIEAMASGIPAIMTPVGSSNSFILNGVNGYFCDQDAKDIANKVLSSQKFSPQAIEESVRKFSWREVAKTYLKRIENND